MSNNVIFILKCVITIFLVKTHASNFYLSQFFTVFVMLEIVSSFIFLSNLEILNYEEQWLWNRLNSNFTKGKSVEFNILLNKNCINNILACKYNLLKGIFTSLPWWEVPANAVWLFLRIQDYFDFNEHSFSCEFLTHCVLSCVFYWKHKKIVIVFFFSWILLLCSMNWYETNSHM